MANTRKRAPARKPVARRTTTQRTYTRARSRRRRSSRKGRGIAGLGFSLPRGLPRLPELDQRQRDVIGLGLLAAVGGFEQPAARPLERLADLPGGLPRGPQHGIHSLRVGWIEGQVHGAGVLVLEDHVLPRRAAIDRAEDAPLGIGAVGMAEHRREDALRVMRIDDVGGDLLGVVQALA